MKTTNDSRPKRQCPHCVYSSSDFSNYRRHMRLHGVATSRLTEAAASAPAAQPTTGNDCTAARLAAGGSNTPQQPSSSLDDACYYSGVDSESVQAPTPFDHDSQSEGDARAAGAGALPPQSGPVLWSAAADSTSLSPALLAPASSSCRQRPLSSSASEAVHVVPISARPGGGGNATGGTSVFDNPPPLA